MEFAQGKILSRRERHLILYLNDGLLGKFSISPKFFRAFEQLKKTDLCHAPYGPIQVEENGGNRAKTALFGVKK